MCLSIDREQGNAPESQILPSNEDEFDERDITPKRANPEGTLDSIVGLLGQDRDANFEPMSQYSPFSEYRVLSKSIGLLKVQIDETVYSSCTATVISDKLILTAWHCLSRSNMTAQRAALQMGYYDVDDVNLVETYDVDINPVEFNKDLDYVILRVDGDLSKWGAPPFDLSPVEPLTPLTLVQHPAGLPKQITRWNCKVGTPAVYQNRLSHSCDTMMGSSGSPIFAERKNGLTMIAMHWAGRTVSLDAPTKMEGFNRAIPLSSIYNDSAVFKRVYAEQLAAGRGPTSIEEVISNQTIEENSISRFELSDQPRIALVVGVSDYNLDGDLDDGPHSAAVELDGFATDLVNPINDAKDIAAELSKIGFTTVLVENPTKPELRSALFDFEREIESAGPDALVVVFYAGHAIQVSGTNYLVPSNAKLPELDFRRMTEPEIESNLLDHTVPINLLYDRLSNPSKVGVNLIILDACRNNPWESRISVRSVGISRGRGLADIDVRLNRTAIWFATRPGDIAEDGDGQNSPYTSVLKRHIGSPGINIRDIFDIVAGEVIVFTDERQTPWANTTHLGDTCLGACIVN